MSVAVITYVYNESVNLPIWIKHYGAAFGERNLFVVDHGSNDGSVDSIGEANLIRIPRDKFDEDRKTGLITSLHRALLFEYDAVVYTDGDELIIPDPSLYSDLSDYITKSDFDYITCIGLNVHHIISREPPIDLGRSILSQRRYARFISASCKTLISRKPISWARGFHSCDKIPQFDPNLYLFHLKFMDYGYAMLRQRTNLEIEWSEQSLKQNFGVHHRYGYERFVREGFLDAANVVSSGKLEPFEFTDRIQQVMDRTVERGGLFYIPMDVASWVEVPDRFSSAL